MAGGWLRGAESGPGINYLGYVRLANIALNIILNIYSYGSSILWSLNRLLGALAQYSNVAGGWLRGAESGPGINYLGSVRLANIALNIILNIYLHDSSIISLV